MCVNAQRSAYCTESTVLKNKLYSASMHEEYLSYWIYRIINTLIDTNRFIDIYFVIAFKKIAFLNKYCYCYCYCYCYIKEVTVFAPLTAGAAKTSKILRNISAERLHLMWDFQNSLWNFSSSNIKEITVLAPLTAGTAENGKIRSTIYVDCLRLIWDFQNCL